MSPILYQVLTACHRFCLLGSGATLLGDDAAPASLAHPSSLEGIPGASRSAEPEVPRGLGAVPERPGGHGGPRGPLGAQRNVAQTKQPADRDRSDFAAPGCQLKRYFPDNSQPYWFAKQPPGREDSEGRRSRKLRWGFHTQRSEGETISLLEHWLEDNYRPPA